MLEKTVPYYIQITRILRHELTTGVYPAASRMPDENTLAARFGVSKDVIRVSMRLLAREGLVKAIRSRGTFVCEPPVNVGSQFVLLSFHGTFHMDAIRSGIEHCMPDNCDLVLKKNILDDLAREREILEKLDPAALRALIAAPVYNDDKTNSALYASLLQQGVPVLIIDHSLPDLLADEISFDEYGATVNLTREALARAGKQRISMFVTDNSSDPIRRMRNQAMLDTWKDFGGSSETRRLYFVKSSRWHCLQEAKHALKTYLNDGSDASVVLMSSTPLAWDFFQLLRETGKADHIQQLSGVGDILRGDDDFNHRLFAHYRLFDDFTPLIQEILTARLSGNHSPAVPIRHSIGFKYMSYDQIRRYFMEKMS